MLNIGLGPHGIGRTAAATEGVGYPAPIDPPSVTATGAYVLNADTGQVYYSKAATTTDDAASITKLATCILVARRFADLTLTTTVVAGDIVGGSTANLATNDVVSLRSLLLGALIPSGNDAAYALARYWGTSVNTAEGNPGDDPIARAVVGMNALAAELGMSTTAFTNPSGQTTGGVCVSSARDLALLLREALDTGVLVPLMKWYIHRISVTGGRTANLQLTNSNDMIEQGDEGVFAGKTGTGGAGEYNLAVGWLSPSGERIVAVVLTSSSDANRYVDMRAILAQLVVDFPALATFAWTPDSLTNKGAWLDPADLSTQYQDTAGTTPVTAAAQTVARINDKWGGAANAQQSTGTARPTLRNPSGSVWEWQLDGGDWLTFGAQTVGGTGLYAGPADSHMVFVVAEFDGTPGTILAKASSAGPRTYQLYGDTASSVDPGLQSRGGGNIVALATGIVGESTPYALATIWDGSEGAIQVPRKRGWVRSVEGAGSDEAQNILIGARTQSSPGALLTGKVRQLIICDGYVEAEWVQALRYVNRLALQ